jgi:4'-phosphopantetheinyl transferase EntD
MLDSILPPSVVVVETRQDSPHESLFPQERGVVSRAVDSRRREFTTARACARSALVRLGLPAVAIPTGARGEPLWPPGVVGSITHCDGYRACAVARSEDLVTVGIDVEPHAKLPDGLIADIARPEELPGLRELARRDPLVHWDRVLFCAKEATYKAWYPLAQRWLGFEDAAVTFDYSRERFRTELLVPGPVAAGRQIKEFSGRWRVSGGLILAAIACPR